MIAGAEAVAISMMTSGDIRAGASIAANADGTAIPEGTQKQLREAGRLATNDTTTSTTVTGAVHIAQSPITMMIGK
jgi:hypothetical protein